VTFKKINKLQAANGNGSWNGNGNGTRKRQTDGFALEHSIK